MAKALPILTLTPVSRLGTSIPKPWKFTGQEKPPLAGEQMRARLSPSWVSLPLQPWPTDALVAGSLVASRACFVSVKPDAITTKLLYFLQTVFPFAIS